MYSATTEHTAFSDRSIERVREYWNQRPCNVRHSPEPVGTRAYFDQVEARKYFVEFATEGSCNYALTLLLREPNAVLWDNVARRLRQLGVEFRRGMSGGGNQLRQPYLRGLVCWDPAEFPNVEHVHFYGCYIGNHAGLEPWKIDVLCEALNELPANRPNA